MEFILTLLSVNPLTDNKEFKYVVVGHMTEPGLRYSVGSCQ